MLALCMCAMPFAAMAAPVDLHHDRDMAVKSLTPELQQQCLNDFAKRRVPELSQLSTAGGLYFNDRISKEVHRMVFWKHSDRGVAFTLPVKARHPQVGNVSAEVVCLYSVADDGLAFELSQPLKWHLSEG